MSTGVYASAPYTFRKKYDLFIIQSGILKMLNILEINFLKKDFMYLYSVFFSKRLAFKNIVHTNPASSMCD